MSDPNIILNNFINELAYIKTNYTIIYNVDNRLITEQLPQAFIHHANHSLRNIDIQNFTDEQLRREHTIIDQAIDLFETLLEDDNNIFTDHEKTKFSDVLHLYNEKKLELERINSNPRTGGKKSRKGKKSGRKNRKSKKSKKSKKRV
uniref:Uncharacterized protein n=1 Tax=viral metagenome TaxID=1070528 RepID=A0A6C0HAC6_9ZZZZ